MDETTVTVNEVEVKTTQIDDWDNHFSDSIYF